MVLILHPAGQKLIDTLHCLYMLLHCDDLGYIDIRAQRAPPFVREFILLAFKISFNLCQADKRHLLNQYMRVKQVFCNMRTRGENAKLNFSFLQEGSSSANIP